MMNQTMTLPKNFASATDEEMMYLDGGGTVSITLKGSTVKTILGSAASASLGGIAMEVVAYVTATAINPVVGVAVAVVAGLFAADIMDMVHKGSWRSTTKKVTEPWLPTLSVTL